MAHSLRSKYLGLKFEYGGSVEMLFAEYGRAWGEACAKMKQEEIGREKSRRALIERGRDEGRAEREQLRTDREQLQAERAQLKARLRTAL
ncbi:hypothetical protein SERLA73DRAFT_188057 [Serpula lacrymans var. lacrymans S7.3]|uniref:Uncharacterized protein n=2 Tax=Serpula lacrymans var. lacrymans TaxID=341189 RepID=F8QBQ8_SERL3|nr:uncharacterized protein SERLADRAFT_478020 [Serpula lacrymans var. lacrymans S7.9]EGN94269.1 hypothetical protein SERLA73DRAFT_188057 [Serpula lacrymans var. lacrymans S7.3]EGO19759.1 hypothetical protein SERLADRAFT_478020 [Serpula lacrymans var. lacrymans S7.9]